MLKTTRKEAFAVGDKYYETGKPCKHGHFSKRETITGACIRCREIAQKEEQERRQEFSKMIQQREG